MDKSQIIHIIEEQLGVSSIQETEYLDQAGADSLDMVELRLTFNLPNLPLSGDITVAALIKLVNNDNN